MGTVSDARAGVAEADQLTEQIEKAAARVDEVLVNMDRLVTGFNSGLAAQNPESFDIDSYLLAIERLNTTIQQANQLLLSTERLASQDHSMGALFDRLLWTGTILILVLCVAIFFTMLIYRATVRHIVPRSNLEQVAVPGSKAASPEQE